jgi:hypothetical protein
MKSKTKKKKKKKCQSPFSLSLICEIVKAEVEHHFEKESLVPVRDQVDVHVKISKSKGKMEFLMEDEGNKVKITCGGTVIQVFKTDFIRELARYLARSVR